MFPKNFRTSCLLQAKQLALRSSTATFQQVMDRIFTDLKWIGLMHHAEHRLRLEGECATEIPHSRSTAKKSMKSDYEGTDEKQTTDQVTSSRRNSDSLSAPSSNLHKASLVSDVLLQAPSNFPSAKSAHGSKNAMQSKEDKDFLQLPLNSHNTSNKHHVSKCSIDSGYQDFHAPQDKHSPGSVPLLVSTPPCSNKTDLQTIEASDCYTTIPKKHSDSPNVKAMSNEYVKLNSTKSANAKNANINNFVEQSDDTKTCRGNNEAILKRKIDSANHHCVKETVPLYTYPYPNNALGKQQSNFIITESKNNNRHNYENIDFERRPIPKQRSLHPQDNKRPVGESTPETQDYENISQSNSSDIYNEMSPRLKQDLKDSASPSINADSSTNNCGCNLIPYSDLSINPVCFQPRQKVVKLRKSSRDKSIEEKSSFAFDVTIFQGQNKDSSVIRRRSMKLMQEFTALNFEEIGESETSECDINRKDSQILSSIKPTSPYFPTASTYSVSPPVASALLNKGSKNGRSIPNFTSFQLTSAKHHLNRNNSFVPSNDKVAPDYENLPLLTMSDLNSRKISSTETLQSLNHDENISQGLKKDRSSPPQLSVFIPPLIRPKPSFRGSCSDQIKGYNNSCNSLKLNLHHRSAFRPVPSSRLQITTRNPFFNAEESALLQDEHESQVGLKRRTSLPSLSVSNKQKYLGELEASSSVKDYRIETSVRPRLLTHQSYRITSRPDHKAIESVISTESPKVTSYQVGTSVPKKTPPYPYVREYSRSELSNAGSGSIKTLPLKSYETLSSNSLNLTSLNSPHWTEHRTSFEKSIPSAFSPSCKGLESTTSSPFAQKVHPPVMSSHENYNSKSSHNRIASTQQSNRTKKESVPSPHHYETVKMITKIKDNSCDRTTSNQVFDLPSTSHSAREPRSNKSALAYIKASLFGKRDKKRQTLWDERKSDASSDCWPEAAKSCSSAKIYRVDSSKSKVSTKDKKAKKNNSEPKQKKSIIRKLSKKQNKNFGFLPDPNNEMTRYGNADAEVMERFLEAAVASHHLPQSPLQRIRSSLRVSRNKDKFLNQNLVKDDLEIRESNQPFGFKKSNKKKVNNKQAFTYV